LWWNSSFIHDDKKGSVEFSTEPFFVLEIIKKSRPESMDSEWLLPFETVSSVPAKDRSFSAIAAEYMGAIRRKGSEK
jgi:hypothetical protein